MCFLFCWLRLTSGYSILAIYPQAFKSHFMFNSAILNILSEAGHEIAFITPFENEHFEVRNSSKFGYKARIATAAQIKEIGIQTRISLIQIWELKTLYEWTAFEEVLCHDIMQLDEISVRFVEISLAVLVVCLKIREIGCRECLEAVNSNLISSIPVVTIILKLGKHY